MFITTAATKLNKVTTGNPLLNEHVFPSTACKNTLIKYIGRKNAKKQN